MGDARDVVPYKALHRCFVVIDDVVIDAARDASDFREASDLNHADGVLFDCPKCRGHALLCLKPEVAEERASGGRWLLDGTGPEDLTLMGSEGGSRIELPNGCRACFSIQDGQAINLEDEDGRREVRRAVAWFVALALSLWLLFGCG